MTRITVHAGNTLLEGFTKTPPVGLCELIWNGFDEDATEVNISVTRNDLQAVDSVVIEDNGRGIGLMAASREFARVGDSWKARPGTTSEGGRPVHGRLGRGRYAAFSIGAVGLLHQSVTGSVTQPDWLVWS